MENMDGWDIALLVVVAYVALSVLVRLMLRHRDEVLTRFRAEMQRSKDKKAKKAEEKPAAAAGRRKAG